MDIGTLARASREQVQARAGEQPAQAPAESPYEDASDAHAIPGTRRVALIVRDKRSGALYLCTRGVSGTGAKRVHMDALAMLGFVHVSDTETLAEAGFVPAPAPTKQPAKKASDK